MKVVQMTLDERLVADVDRVVKRLKTTRSRFTRSALAHEVQRIKTLELERKHREGYAKNPVKPGEFDIWEKEQVWPDWQE